MSTCPQVSRLFPSLALGLLLFCGVPMVEAGGLRAVYRGGNVVASVRLGGNRGVSSWGFRCAPGLVNRPIGYYPGYYGYGYGYAYPGYVYDYGYTGYIGEYYGVRYLSSTPSTTPVPV